MSSVNCAILDFCSLIAKVAALGGNFSGWATDKRVLWPYVSSSRSGSLGVEKSLELYTRTES